MRVLHVIPSLSPARGGPTTAMLAMARGLARANVEVDVVTTDDDGPGRLTVPLEQPISLSNGITARYFARQTSFYTVSWPLTRWLSRNTAAYDLLHIHALFSYPSLPAAAYATIHRVPYVVRPLGTLNRWGMEHRRPLLKRASFRLIERRILRGACAVHYTTEQERREAYPLQIDAPAAVIPIGLDLEPFEALPPAECFLRRYPQLTGRPVVLSLSRLSPKKGIDLLLSAFAQVRDVHPDAALVIAGNGDSSFVHELQAQAASMGIAGSVFWPGFLTGDEKLAALSTATVFVLPSYSENLGIAAVEALAAGVPLIISKHVGIAPDVERRQAGTVVPAEPNPLAQALNRVLAEPTEARAMVLHGKTLAQELFSIEWTTAGLIDLYERVLAQAGSQMLRRGHAPI